jgi:hypothetical protein
MFRIGAEQIDRRQFDIFGLSSISGAAKDTVTVIKKTPQIDDKATREKLLWGPFKVKAANVKSSELQIDKPINDIVKASHTPTGFTLKLDPNSDIISSGVNGICNNCMVLYAQADLAKKDGSKADIGSGVYSHHVIVTNVGHSMVAPPVLTICPNGRKGSLLPPLMPSPKRSKSGSDAKGSMSGMSHGRSKRQATSENGFGALVGNVLGE